MLPQRTIHWEDAFRTVIPQINADGVLAQQFDSQLPIQVRFYAYDPQRDYRSCRHHYFEVFYISSGSALFNIGEQCFPIAAGDLVLINSLLFHNLVVPRTARRQVVRGVLLYFLPEIFRGFGAAREDALYLEPFLRQDDHFPYVIPAATGIPAVVSDLIHAIAGELPARNARARLTAKTFLKMALVHLLNYYSAYQGATDSFDRKHEMVERLGPLFRYLDEHYAEPITLDTAAGKVGMSKSHFVHLMKQVTGMSFISYLNQFRISKAQTLMATTSKSLTEISYEVGFCDQSYFGKLFRRLLMVTPRQYRLQLDLESRSRQDAPPVHNKA